MLPVAKILWAPTNAAHRDHLHVEGPHVHGRIRDDCTSRWTPAIQEIVAALNARFGKGDHHQVWDDTLSWTHMGVYNCRNIAGTNIPSQHAFSNAIDIGPYYGVTQQQRFYDFLTGNEEDMLTPHEEAVVKRMVAELDALGSDGSFAKYTVQHLRNHPTSGTVDSTARSIATAARDSVNSLLAKLRKV